MLPEEIGSRMYVSFKYSQHGFSSRAKDLKEKYAGNITTIRLQYCFNTQALPGTVLLLKLAFKNHLTSCITNNNVQSANN